MSWARSKHLGSALSSPCPPEESSYSWWDVAQPYCSPVRTLDSQGPPRELGGPLGSQGLLAVPCCLLSTNPLQSALRASIWSSQSMRLQKRNILVIALIPLVPRWFFLLTSISQTLTQCSIFSRCSADISNAGIGPAILIRKVLGTALHAGVPYPSSHLLPAFLFFASAGRLQQLRLGWAHYGGARSLRCQP